MTIAHTRIPRERMGEEGEGETQRRRRGTRGILRKELIMRPVGVQRIGTSTSHWNVG